MGRPIYLAATHPSHFFNPSFPPQPAVSQPPTNSRQYLQRCLLPRSSPIRIQLFVFFTLNAIRGRSCRGDVSRDLLLPVGRGGGGRGAGVGH